MTCDLSSFISLDESITSRITMGDGTILVAKGKGTIQLNSLGLKYIPNVLYVPNLNSNLLSVGQFMLDGYSLVFEESTCWIFQDKSKKHLLASVPMAKNKIFPYYPISNVHVLKTTLADENWLWHFRYGRLNFKSLTLMAEQNLVDGLPFIKSIDDVCESCVVGKQHRDSFPTGKARRALQCAELIHADVCGPMRTPSLNTNRYFLAFVDSFSIMTWVYFVKEKSDVFSIFKKFKACIEKQSGQPIKVLRTDRGGEFLSEEFNKFCEEFGIQR